MQEHDGHRARLKERFDKTRLLGFADHEVLELILFHSIPRRDTNPIAHALIDLRDIHKCSMQRGLYIKKAIKKQGFQSPPCKAI